MKFHGIVVALGAAEACRSYFGEGSGSLIVASSHMLSPEQKDMPPPFTVIPDNGDGDILHVFDDVSLDIALRELDTISDFTSYLDKKENFINKGNFGIAHGEEDLISAYLREINSNGEHDFVEKSYQELTQNQILSYAGGGYISLRANKQYRRKKQADRISYLWDEIINRFSTHLMEGSSITVDGFEDLAGDETNFELGVRQLALESRLQRRSHSEAIIGAFEAVKSGDLFFEPCCPARPKQIKQKASSSS